MARNVYFDARIEIAVPSLIASLEVWISWSARQLSFECQESLQTVLQLSLRDDPFFSYCKSILRGFRRKSPLAID